MYQTALLFILAASSVALPQSSIRIIPGVSEPPELLGEPKKFQTPSDRDKQLMSIMDKWSDRNIEKLKVLRPEFDKFILQYPEYSDGYVLRAMADLCYLKSTDYSGIEGDLKKAISIHTNENYRMFSRYEVFGLLAKVHFLMGHYQVALDDLDMGVRQNVDDASRIFMAQGIKPEISGAFLWSKSDVEKLVQEFPKDYRSYLLRGLYLNVFATFDESYYQLAMQDFRHALALNSRSPLPHYFIGHVYTQSAMWAKAAWASDEVKLDYFRKAALECTKAIELDPAFLPAFEMRAMSYLQLKQSQEAIQDYDRVLELDSEKAGIYHDRALAKMDLNEYGSAIVDFNAAIKRQKPNDDSLGMMYENRADCYSKNEEYENAISDLSKAIGLQLGSQGFLFSINQFRTLYPEYDGVSDETFIRKLSYLFWPQYTYEVLLKQLRGNKGWAITLMAELYEKRADAYLRANQFRRAAQDFNRIFKGIPDFTVDRWRLLGVNPAEEEYSLDIRTLEFLPSGITRLWLKSISKTKSYRVESYEIDCRNRRINFTSFTTYNAERQATSSSESTAGWQRIIPETLGEHLYNGACVGDATNH